MCHLHHPENDFISKTYKIGHETPLRVQTMEHNPTTMITMVVSVMTLYLGANGQWWFKKNYQMLHAALHLTFWNKSPTKFKIGGKTQCFCAANCTLQQCQKIKQMQFLQSQKNPCKNDHQMVWHRCCTCESQPPTALAIFGSPQKCEGGYCNNL